MNNETQKELIEALQLWVKLFSPEIEGNTSMAKAAREILLEQIPPEIRLSLDVTQKALDKALKECCR